MKSKDYEIGFCIGALEGICMAEQLSDEQQEWIEVVIEKLRFIADQDYK